MTVNNSASQQIMHTMQRLKFLLVLLIAFILVIVASFSYFGSHRLNITSSLIKGVTDVEERHYYNIHSWQGKSVFKNTHSTFMPLSLSVVFPANAFLVKSFYVHSKAETGLKKEVGAL